MTPEEHQAELQNSISDYVKNFCKIDRDFLRILFDKEIFHEVEFTGFSENVRIDSRGNRWFFNNDQYTKFYGKYDAYAYEWTVGTGEDYRSSYIQDHPMENMNFEDFLGYIRENGLDSELNESAII